MAFRLPPLAAIRAFEAASRHLSFTRAGDELGMTQAAVSYQIKLLEEKLGFDLFVRKARKIDLTEKGAQLSARVIEAFGDLRGAFEEIQDQNESQLVVASNTTFAVNWLASRLFDFQMKNPDLAVRLVPFGPMAAPDFLDADVTISACHTPPKNWRKHKLVNADFSPMLSPDLAASIGGVHEPSDLLKLPIVDPDDPWWGIWFTAAGLKDADVSQWPSSRMGSQALEANRAIAGQGVAILTPYFCQMALKTGQLVQPFHLLAAVDEEAWFLSYSEARRNSRKIRLFRDWVLQELHRDGMPDQSEPPVVTERAAS